MDGTTILALLGLGAAVSALTAAIKAAGVPSRFLPLVPLVLGALGAVLVPSATPASDTGTAVIYGVLAGAFSGQIYEAVSYQFKRALPPAGGGSSSGA